MLLFPHFPPYHTHPQANHPLTASGERSSRAKPEHVCKSLWLSYFTEGGFSGLEKCPEAGRAPASLFILSSEDQIEILFPILHSQAGRRQKGGERIYSHQPFCVGPPGRQNCKQLIDHSPLKHDPEATESPEAIQEAIEEGHIGTNEQGPEAYPFTLPPNALALPTSPEWQLFPE